MTECITARGEEQRATLATAVEVTMAVYNAAFHNSLRAHDGLAPEWPVLDGGELPIDIERGLALLRICYRDLTDPDDRTAIRHYADSLIDARASLDEAIDEHRAATTHAGPIAARLQDAAARWGGAA